MGTSGWWEGSLIRVLGSGSGLGGGKIKWEGQG